MNILFSLTNLSRGGAQLFVIHLAHEFAKNKENKVYIYDHNPEYSSPEIYAYARNKVEIISYSRSWITRFLIQRLNGLINRLGIRWNFRNYINKIIFKKNLIRKKIEVVNSHMSASDFICAEIVPNFIKLVVTLHGEIELYKSNPEIFTKTLKLLDRKPFIIYTAEKNKNIIEPYLKEKRIDFEKIYIGINPSEFEIKNIVKQDVFNEEHVFVLGMISRGIPEKGWLFLTELFEKLSKKYSHLRLLLIGDGNYLQMLIKNLNNPKIRLIQLTENFQDYFSFYSLMDLFVFPTFFEGESVPTVVAESMYWEIPVLANDHAEIKNMMLTNNGLAGECIKIESKEEMVNNYIKAIDQLINNPEKLEEKKINCINAFRKFEIEVIKNRYWEIFQRHSPAW
jgi:L-malate glycosyltransferase